MNDLIPNEEQRHRENVERAEEFFERNPTLQEFRRKIQIIAGDTPLDEMIEHAEKLIAASKFFIKEVKEADQYIKNQATETFPTE